MLDVGAGTGIASEQLLGKGVNVLAVEPDLRMAKIAKERGIVIEIGRLIASIRAAGFTVEQRTYPRRAHYSLEQWLELVFTYSNHLILAAEKACELRARLAERIGPKGVSVSGQPGVQDYDVEAEARAMRCGLPGVRPDSRSPTPSNGRRRTHLACEP